MAARVFGISSDVFAGLVLALAAVLGLLAENIELTRPLYDALLNLKTTVAIGEAKISKPLLLWINDGLMALFFLLVALEIKREALRGALSTWNRAALPVYSAVGGMVVPALVFLGIVGFESAEASGWAIPAATDIAFAIGVLSLFGNKVPPSLKTFLLALAVVDDLGAIVIIALFYTSKLSLLALGVAGLALVGLFLLNVMGHRRATWYVLLGLVLWIAVLKSGVHATLAGVALGFAIPLKADENGHSMLSSFEHGLHPWIAYGVMPVFAFANAGVPLGGLTWEAFTEPLTMGIAAGLFIGKQIGVFGVAVLVVALGLASKPAEISYRKLYGASLLAGIGFTMSLFIGGLAFDEPGNENAVRIGVLAGSLLSGVLGAIVLAMSRERESVPVTAVEEPAQA